MPAALDGQKRPEEDVGYPGTEVLDSYEPPDIGSGNQNPVLLKSDEPFQV